MGVSLRSNKHRTLALLQIFVCCCAIEHCIFNFVLRELLFDVIFADGSSHQPTISVINFESIYIVRDKAVETVSRSEVKIFHLMPLFASMRVFTSNCLLLRHLTQRYDVGSFLNSNQEADNGVRKMLRPQAVFEAIPEPDLSR